MKNLCTTPGHESRPRSGDLWVCNGCIHGLEEDLASISVLWKELSVTLTRQDVIGGDGGRKSSETALPFKQPASEARWVIGNTIGTWARVLADHLGLQDPLTPARWLAANVDKLAAHPAAGEAVDEIREMVKLAYRVIDRPPELLFAGKCPSVQPGPCAGVLYAKPGDDEVECPECERRYDVTVRRERMLDAAAVLNVTKTTALGWVRLLMDREIPDGTWRSWRTRGRLHVRALSAEGQELFGFGDVRDLAISWMARGKAA